MDYAQQGIAGQALGGIRPAQIQPVQTLAARLERASNMLMAQCDRIEDALARINGTPRAGNKIGGAEKASMTAPLANSVEVAEVTAKRLGELASVLEQVA